ncbi:hypothetical protein WN944_027258 [Citrus x changshan-huyou]|uniref:Protein kinase domain-containing protein n=1 Tax=Citrus x changshan-huyou TaxID=2935761 RepID=A0AAP0LH83_9ROSI
MISCRSNLGQNLLTGKIPPSLGRLSSLRILSLLENGLSGTLPPELGKLSNLEELWLPSNNLRGDLPKDYENLKNLTIFGIGGNYLSGPIPTFIAKWVNLYALILRNCSITGSIPPYIGSWNQLAYLDLSFNDLTGGIPNTFKKLFLYELYLTGNMLNGTLPDWIYINVRDKGDLAYNEFIFPEPEAHKNLPNNNSRINLTFPEEIMREYCPAGQKKSQLTTVNLRGKSYTLKQVKVATRNFSPRNVIGTGRFGTVYKAELPDQTVAVKMLSSQSKHVIDQIGTEVYALTTLKHENIVEFLDGYSKKDLNLLIYEYMEKGSLERALFDANSSTRLDWPTRVRICHGIAKGLKYLHEDNPSRKIVHRNIKPSNILLDGNLNAKVSDLGLAKLYDEENPYKFIQEKGTVVYMAPEYAMRKAITEKVDVFSFGIVLLEIISGQTNAKYEANQETEFLLDTAIVLHSKGRLSELVDKQMPNEHVVMKQAKIILELAMRCVDQSPTLRPTMSEVVSELERISN